MIGEQTRRKENFDDNEKAVNKRKEQNEGREAHLVSMPGRVARLARCELPEAYGRG